MGGPGPFHDMNRSRYAINKSPVQGTLYMRIPRLTLNVGNSHVGYSVFTKIYLSPIREPIGTIFNPKP